MKILSKLSIFVILVSSTAQSVFAAGLVTLSTSLPSHVYLNQKYDNVVLAVTNPGTTALFVNGIYHPQYPAGFTPTSATCTNVLLAANDSCTITGNFIPTQLGVNTWSGVLGTENYLWTQPYSISVNVENSASPSSELNSQLQNEINNLYYQFKNSPAFSAVQLSVLLPDETQPRDYIVGTQSTENLNIPATTQMLTQYGSITKEFTSALIINYMFNHPDALTLQSTLFELFPNNFPPQGDWPTSWQTITLQQLMNMTSGISNYTLIAAAENPNLHYTMEQIIQGVANFENTQGCNFNLGCFAPAGSQYAYSNTNYILLGLVVESLYGETYANVLNNMILQQEQTNGNSIYYYIDYPENVLANMLNGYWDSPIITPFFTPGENITNINLSWGASAAALTGNTHALVNIINNFYNNNILPADQTQYLTQTGFVTIDTGAPVDFIDAPDKCTYNIPCYGLGVNYYYDANYGDVYFYPGATLGYNTVYVFLADYNIVIGLSINTILDSVYQEVSNNTLPHIVHTVFNYVSENSLRTKRTKN